MCPSIPWYNALLNDTIQADQAVPLRRSGSMPIEEVETGGGHQRLRRNLSVRSSSTVVGSSSQKRGVSPLELDGSTVSNKRARTSEASQLRARETQQKEMEPSGESRRNAPFRKRRREAGDLVSVVTSIHIHGTIAPTLLGRRLASKRWFVRGRRQYPHHSAPSSYGSGAPDTNPKVTPGKINIVNWYRF